MPKLNPWKQARQTPTPRGLNLRYRGPEPPEVSTYTQILYHIVFSTMNREMCLSDESRPKLYRYIWGIIKNNNTHLYRINGTADHLHILSSLHPSVCLADFVKEIKLGIGSVRT